MQDGQVEAIGVGAGPNGLAAAITLARAGRSVRVCEVAPEAGGGTRTMELTLPGFRHDICSTILPLTVASPFFATIDLAARGVDLIHPDTRRSRTRSTVGERSCSSDRWRRRRPPWAALTVGRGGASAPSASRTNPILGKTT
jgi:phytoene dehydrogenase-like protein